MRKLSGRRPTLSFGAALALAALCTAAACSGGGGASSAARPPVYGTPGPPPGETPPPGTVRKYVKRVVVIVQENRSFDNLFHGFPGARTARYGYLHDGTKVALRAAGLTGPDVSHVWRDAINDWNHGKMNGFDLNRSNGHQAGRYAYQYVAKRYIEPYWDMAQQYVLADEMFPTMFGGSFTAHLDLIAGTTDLRSGVAEVDVPLALPWGCDAPGGTRTSLLDTSRIERWGGGPFPCFTQFATAADLLDRAHVSWAYYAPAVGGRNIAGKVWSEFDAISAVRRGPDWSRNVISPPGRVLEDIGAGRLPRVAWIIPDSTDSDHAGEGSDTGPSWVTSVVNAVGESPYWDSTVIVVLWDDWGGWYDSVAPPQLDYRGLGIRVPCIVISAYVRQGHVSHTQYEFGSILQFIEEVFGMPSLGSLQIGGGYTDARANSISDVFDFTQAVRPFQPISAPNAPSYFLTKPASLRAPDSQ
jgi:phospholipase C